MGQLYAFRRDDDEPAPQTAGSGPFNMDPLGSDTDNYRAAGRDTETIHVDEILREGVGRGASDVHLTVGLPPCVRVDGRLCRMDFTPLEAHQIQRMIYDILTKDQILWLEKSRELDFSYGLSGVGRFRVNVYRQRGSLGAAFRVVPSDIPTMEQLRLPPICKELTGRGSGLILVTGPTGAGKSTTIASMIDYINTHRPVHIVTIEDPIEYLHRHKVGMVNQRELNADTDSFENALRAVLREDPDVILVGEMRDLETISAALTLAETGHLVFGTLHTRSAAQTIDRIIDVFPPHQQAQIRVQLANTLEAVISQLLLPMNGGGRVAAHEILVATSAVRNLIREGKSYQIGTLLETSQAQGMQPMDRALVDLHLQGLVGLEEARMRAVDPENFDRYLRGG
ncbi:MAG: twitching motility protein PilT [Armatimonadota bacterium]|nr:MAG: twitching motility protein PilT [Armatimonadota bacterium]